MWNFLRYLLESLQVLTLQKKRYGLIIPAFVGKDIRPCMRVLANRYNFSIKGLLEYNKFLIIFIKLLIFKISRVTGESSRSRLLIWIYIKSSYNEYNDIHEVRSVLPNSRFWSKALSWLLPSRNMKNVQIISVYSHTSSRSYFLVLLRIFLEIYSGVTSRNRKKIIPLY